MDIAACFAFLAALFTVLDTDASALTVTLAAGVCACSMSVSLLSMEEKRVNHVTRSFQKTDCEKRLFEVLATGIRVTLNESRKLLVSHHPHLGDDEP